MDRRNFLKMGSACAIAPFVWKSQTLSLPAVSDAGKIIEVPKPVLDENQIYLMVNDKNYSGFVESAELSYDADSIEVAHPGDYYHSFVPGLIIVKLLIDLTIKIADLSFENVCGIRIRRRNQPTDVTNPEYVGLYIFERFNVRIERPDSYQIERQCPGYNRGVMEWVNPPEKIIYSYTFLATGELSVSIEE